MRKVWTLVTVAWFSSLGVVWEYGGLPGLVAYTAGMAVLAWLIPRLHLSKRVQLTIVGVGALVGLATLLVVYPHANVQTAAAGSDADDALNVAARAFVHGRYLYGQKTYLGNPIAPLPGAVLLALPFVLLFGSSAYQALAWWPAFVLTLRRSHWWFTAVALTFASVEVWRSLATGSDGFVNGIYVAVLALLLLDRPTVPRAIAFGIALSSRALLFPVAPLELLVLWTEDRRTAVRAGVAAFAAFCLVTLPFYFWSPSGFGPIHTEQKLTVNGSPALGIALVVVGFVAAAWWMRGQRERVWWATSFALGLPVLVLSVVAIAIQGTGAFYFTRYGLEVLPFVAMAVAFEQSRQSTSSFAAHW